MRPQRPIVSAPPKKSTARAPISAAHRIAPLPKQPITVPLFAGWRLPATCSRYERIPEQADDYRQRMLANVAAFAFTVALLAIGIWLTISIAELRRTQDCVLMGRHDCVQIAVPQHQPF